MTFSKFETLFKSKYPDGQVWMHDEFEHGVAGRRQKVAVQFNPKCKAYMYRGAYEDILCRIGINVISKQRFGELEGILKRLIERQGEPDFFGGVVDNSVEIDRIEKEIADYKSNYIIA